MRAYVQAALFEAEASVPVSRPTIPVDLVPWFKVTILQGQGHAMVAVQAMDAFEARRRARAGIRARRDARLSKPLDNERVSSADTYQIDPEALRFTHYTMPVGAWRF